MRFEKGNIKPTQLNPDDPGEGSTLEREAANRARYGDAAFTRAMLAARKAGHEKFTLGPIRDDTPLIPTRFDPPIRASGCSSGAALCIDETVGVAPPHKSRGRFA